MSMYSTYFETQSGQADKKAVQTLTREVSRIITEQVKKSMSRKNEAGKETKV